MHTKALNLLMVCNIEVVDRPNGVIVDSCIFPSIKICRCKLACANLFVCFLIRDVFHFC